jgi:hypothetical protein
MTLSRDQWLTEAMNKIIDVVFKPVELRMPPLLRIAAGLLPGKALGVCTNPLYADDGAVHIWITPEHGADDVMAILGTIVHELCHAVAHAEGYNDCGHGHPFSKYIRDVGLEGKPKHATAVEGTELWATLSGIAAELGPYDHAPLRKKESKKRNSDVVTWISTTDPEFEVKAKYALTVEKGTPRDPSAVPMEPKDKGKYEEIAARHEAGLTEEEEAEKAEEKEME